MPVKYICSKCGAESEPVTNDAPGDYMTLQLQSGKFDLCPACQLELLNFLSPTGHTAASVVALDNAVEVASG